MHKYSAAEKESNWELHSSAGRSIVNKLARAKHSHVYKSSARQTARSSQQHTLSYQVLNKAVTVTHNMVT